jgi:tRNA dimethylallyltransferase
MAQAGKPRSGKAASTPTLVIIAGPTASGKSALAMALARRLRGTVINADAMQCYRDLRVLTARPTPDDEKTVPHRLYGVRAAAEPANAAWWRQAALDIIKKTKTPILCGGTGMYLSALLHGIAEIPDPGAAARAQARALLAEIGAPALHARLDPATAAKLRPNDSQRVARAYEVLAGTGTGLATWQSRPAEKLTGWRTKMLLLDPPREDLHRAIAGRFAAMLEAGAVAEVQNLLALNLDPALPLLRAHGVPELARYLAGDLSLQEAARRAILSTQQYTKRQATWFRYQKLVENAAMQIFHARIEAGAQLSESFLADLINFIKAPG